MTTQIDIAQDFSQALDASLLFEKTVGTPDKYQRQILRSTSRGVLVNACRQGGKTETVAALAVHQAVYNPGSLTIIVSPSLRQSTEVYDRTLRVLKRADVSTKIKNESASRLVLDNGSKILSLPGGSGDQIRGFSPDLVIFDEAARASDELFTAVSPMVAVSGGRIVALTTPYGKRGWFFELFTSRDTAWERIKVTAHDVDRIDPDWLESERQRMTDRDFRQEFLAEFADATEATFTFELLQSAIDPNVSALDLSKRSEKPREFVISWDVAKAQDHSAVAIAELTQIEQNGRDQTRADIVHLERLPKGAKYTEQMERLAVLRFNTIEELNHCPLIVDSSGVGAGVTDVMEDEFNLCPTSVTITGGDSSRQDDETHRWRVSKLALVNSLQMLLQRERLFFAHDLPLLEEMLDEFQNFETRVSPSGQSIQWSARQGHTDDAVMALAMLAWHVTENPPAEFEYLGHRSSRGFVREPRNRGIWNSSTKRGWR